MADPLQSTEAHDEAGVPSPSIRIRGFLPTDAPALREVHRGSIAHVASAHYDPGQIAAWLSLSGDAQAWAARMQRLQPMVAVAGQDVAGYADLQSDGLIDHFFVAAHWQGRGVARLLMEAILRRAQERKLESLHSFVSRTAQPLYRRFGFVVVEECFPVVAGVQLHNSHMRLDRQALD